MDLAFDSPRSLECLRPGIGTQLRGGDEIGYLNAAHQLAATPWFSAPWTPLFSKAGTNNLHIIVFATQIKAFSFGAGALRVTQVAIALLGLLLIVAAVYDLAGRRAALITAWIGAVEPTSVFFSGTLLKEPLLELAAGLVIFGGTQVWRRFQLGGLVWMAAGCLVAVFDRGYIGFFLITASALLLLHVSSRNLRRRLKAIPLFLGVLLVAAVLSPTLVNYTSPANLRTFLQDTQNANTLVTPAPSVAGEAGQANGNNLALEPINFSSRTNVIIHLPQRLRDLLVRPYPWQTSDWSQRFGAIGTIIAVALLALLLRFGWICRGSALRRTAPLLYPTLMMTIAYSLSVGNAGTGFRYRAHLIIPAIGMLAILWTTAPMAIRARRGRPVSRPWEPVIPSSRPSPVVSTVAQEV